MFYFYNTQPDLDLNFYKITPICTNALSCLGCILYLGVVPGYCTWVLYLFIVPGYCTCILYLGIVPVYCTWVLYLGIVIGLKLGRTQEDLL